MKRFNPLAADVLPNPYPHYADLRQHDPVHWGIAEDGNLPGRWYVTRLDDIAAILKDDRFGREVQRVVETPPTPPADQQLAEVAEGWMILRDPPTHTRLRQLVMRTFTPRRVEKLRPHIAATAEMLLDRIEAMPQPVDVLAAFALPLPALMVAELLGLPTKDQDQLMDWSRALAAVIDLNQTEDIRAKSRQAVSEFVTYLREVIAARQQHPQDDLISALIHDGDSLSADELVGTISHLLFVGNDPVMHLIGNGIITLLQHPDQLQWLHANPDRIEGAVDELLRYDSSVQMTFRFALTDVAFGGRTLKTGDHIAVVLGSANRDPAYHPDPDRLDLSRDNRHLMHFGLGIHYCLGAALARIEGQIALNALLRRLPNLALASEDLQWQQTAAVRGVEALPITF